MKSANNSSTCRGTEASNRDRLPATRPQCDFSIKKPNPSFALAAFCLLFAVLPPVALGQSGDGRSLTIITHGFQLTGEGPVIGGIPSWVEPMANEIVAKKGAGKVIRLTFDSGVATVAGGGDAQTLASSGATVIIFDWSDKSNNTGNAGWREGAGDFLANFLIGSGLVQAAKDAGIPIHIIGHSLGTIVNSEAIRRLGVAGIAVDQMTTLDPHDQDQDGIPDPPDDPQVKVWSNVLFTDNYWEDNAGSATDHLDNFYHLGVPYQLPVGHEIPGAFNRDLTVETRFLNEAEMLDIIRQSGPHSRIHEWYYRTIRDQMEPGGTANADLQASRNWYLGSNATSHGFALAQSAAREASNLSALGMTFLSGDKANPYAPLPASVFNGDFRFPDYDLSGFLPGFDDGNGPELVNTGDAHGYAAKLHVGNLSFKHRQIWIPPTARTLTFEYNVQSPGGRLNFSMADIGGAGIGAFSFPLSDQSPGWQKYTWPIPPELRGQWRDFSVSLSEYGLGSSVWVDNVEIVAGPANDAFADAATLTGANAQDSQTNVNATKETGEPDHAGDAGGHSVWWEWVAPSSGLVATNTVGSDFDTLLAVYTGSSVNALTLVAADDDGGGNRTSALTFNAAGGTTYWIAVDGYNGATGSIAMALNLSIQTAGLVAHWSFDQDDARDNSGNGHNGTLNGGATFATGCVGRALQLDGVNDYVRIPDFTTSPADRRSICLWVKQDAVRRTTQDILSNHSNPSDCEYLIRSAADGKYDFVWTIGGQLYDGSAGGSGGDDGIGLIDPVAGVWNFLVLTYDGATIRFFNNATLVRAIPATGSIANSYLDLRMGSYAWNGTNPFRGYLDEIRIYNYALSASEIQSLYSQNGQSVAPSITTPPQSQTVTAGQDVIFTVLATGNPAPSYQWYVKHNGTWAASVDGTQSDGSTVSGSTMPTLTIANVRPGQNGNIYQVTVTNAAGFADSAQATLTVATPPPPIITTQPASRSASPGYGVTFSVTASSTTPLSYQWEKDGTVISGATDATLTLASVQAGDAGSYTVVVTNGAGSVTSSPATLTVDTPYHFFTFAGLAGQSGSIDGIGAAARFNQPMGVTVDGVGNVFVADTYNATIRKVTPAGVVSTLAGLASQTGSADGTGSSARFGFPAGVTVDAAGNVFVADAGNATIRKITPAGVVSTLAGLAGQTGSADGTGSSARFGEICFGLAVDAAGNVFVADTYNATIRKVTPAGVVSTLAGLAGQTGSADGTGSSARFGAPGGIAVDAAGNVFVADNNNATIRKVTLAGVVSTLAGLAGQNGNADGTGSSARFGAPTGVAVNGAGNVFVADAGNATIRKITPAGVVSTLAGLAGQTGSADGTGSSARFRLPFGVFADGAGNLHVTDVQNSTIRKGVPYTGSPIITVQPQSQGVTAGSSVNLSVTAVGNAPLSYQWKKNGSAISGATNATLTLVNFQANDAGLFTVFVSNNAGNATSYPATVAVSAPPSITTPPTSQTATAGATVTFSVVATGGPAPTYQWNFNGVPIAGATNVTLTLTNVQLANAGNYSVTVSNGIGTVTSNVVTLSGSNPAPTITTQPAFVTATSGQPATLSVTATGSGALAYRWRKAGAFVAGATTTSLTVPTATMADAAYYDVVINEGLSLTTSQQGRITVVPASTSGSYRLDTSFAPLIESEWATVWAVAKTPEGGFYAGGTFTTIAGQRRHSLAKFNADGTIVPSFVPIVVGNVYAMMVQPDGKLVVGGSFLQVNGVARNRIARLNADGTLDPGFDPGSGFDQDVWSLALQADGKIVAAGYFYSFNGTNRRGVARLNANGSLDTMFSPGNGASDGVNALALASDGKIVIGGYFTSFNGTTRNRVARLNVDGSLDTTFDPGEGASGDYSWNSRIEAVVVLPDGKLIVGGPFTRFGGQSYNRIARLNANGSIDTGFTVGTGFNSDVLSIALQSDGKVLVGGYFGSYNGATRSQLARLNADGTLDSTWAPTSSPDNAVNYLEVLSDGRVLAGGQFKNIGTSAASGVARLMASGALDAAPAGAIRERGGVYSVVPVTGGKWMIVGYFYRVNGTARNQIARLNADGSLDASFDPGSGFDGGLYSLAVQGDGKLVAGGWFGSYNGESASRFVRINPDGSRDATFDIGTGGDSGAYRLAVQADGRIVATGYFSTINGVARQRIARLNANGSVDASFDSASGLSDSPSALTVQRDGKVLVAGHFSTYAGQARNRIARINADGTVDSTFSVGTGFTYSPYALNLLDDGRVVVGGDIYSYNGVNFPYGLARLNPDGTLDPTLNTGSGAGSYISALAAAPGGRLLAGGWFTSFNGAARNRLAVINADGSLDSSFASYDLVSDNSYMYGAQFADDGRLLVWGLTATRGSAVQNSLVMLKPDTAPAPASIAAQPTSQTAAAGGSVTFSVIAAGEAPLTYQWRKNGVAIGGATNATLTLANVQLADVADYTVTVTNAYGSATSAAATIAGSNPAPTITVPPGSVTVTAGQPATFSVTATGTGALTYQWRRNGVPISGTTGDSYTIASASRTDADYYNVVVIDGLSVTTSATARLSVAPTSYAQAVALDPASTVAFESDFASIYQVWPLADGRFYAGGDFIRANGIRQLRLGRFNTDGTLDVTFAPPSLSGDVKALLVQPDGKVVVGGYFYNVAGNRSCLVRLNPDGSFDSVFRTRGMSNGVYALALQGDGRLLVGTSSYSSYIDQNGTYTSRGGIARLNADGTLDTAFNPGANSDVLALAVQADGKILAGGWFSTIAGQSRSYLARLNTDGTFDSTFAIGTGPNNVVEAIALQADGKALVGGSFSVFNGATAGRFVRLSSNGAPDASFGSGSGFNGDVLSFAVQTDGRVLAGGWFGSYNGATRSQVARLNADGTLDTAFAPTPNSTVNSVAVQADGRVLLGGYFTAVNGVARSALARVGADAALDTTFAPAFRRQGYAYASALLPGGKMLVGGEFTRVGGAVWNNLVRFSADGTVDSTFGSDTGPNGTVWALVIQPDGKVVLGGSFGGYNGVGVGYGIARITTTGALDTTFSIGSGASSDVRALTASPGGKIVVGGFFTSFNGAVRNRIARLNADGTLDPAFDPGAGLNGAALALAVASDGKVYVGGYFTTLAGVARQWLARLNADGTLDTTFADPGLNGYVTTLALQPDGRLFAGGSFGGSGYWGLARFNADGTRDTTFNTSAGSPNSVVQQVVLQEDGRVLVGGNFSSVGGATNTGYLARFNADGTRDASFAAVNLLGYVSTLLVRDNGQLFLTAFDGVTTVAGFTTSSTVPTITAQPAGQTVSAGATVTLSVTADGTAPLAYQWSKNGSALAGATGATLTIASAQPEHTGVYSVTVTNAVGSATSNQVVVAVAAPAAVPSITSAPSSQIAPSGTAITLSVTATGATSYQWRKNGTPIGGATNSSYIIGNLQTGDAGLYDVVVSNAAGSVTSPPAMVTPPGNANARMIDPAFARPQFKRLAYPYRVIHDGNGRLLVTYDTNGSGALNNVNHQRLDGVVRLDAGTGAVDTGFSNAPTVSTAWGTAVQPDGRILVAGQSEGDQSGAGGVDYYRVVRYFSTGAVDVSYRSPVIRGLGRFMIVQPDGKLLLSTGGTNGTNGVDATGLIRLNTEGSLDATFNPPTLAGSFLFAPPVVDANGRILIAGYFTTVNDVSRPRIARLNSNGTLDVSFVPSGFTSTYGRGIGIQSDGKIVVGGRFNVGGVNYSVIRLNPDGTLDPTFTLVPTATLGFSYTNRASMLRVQSDDKIVAIDNKVVRLNANGTVDPTFVAATLSTGVFWFDVLSDGRVVVPTGGPMTVNGSPVGGLFRLNTNGTLDTAFNPGPFASEVFPSIALVQSDGKMLVAGDFDEVNGVVRKGIARFNADGSLDATYGNPAPAGANRFEVSSAVLTSDNRVYATAWTGTADYADTFGFYRATADGTLDTGFVPAASLGLADRSGIAVTVQNDKPVLSGNTAQDVVDGRPMFKRLNVDGSVDASFVAGLTTPLGTLTRVGSSIDTMAVGSFRVLASLPGGGFLASATTGSYPTINTTTGMAVGTFSFTLVEFGSDGSPVAGFSAPAVSGIGGYFNYPTVNDPQNGNVSTQPNYGALYPSQDPFAAAAVLTDGRVVVAGPFTSLGGQPANGIVRLLATGAVDTTFNVGTGPQVLQRTGVQPRIDCVRARSDGKLILTGYFDSFNGCPAGGVVRLNPDGSVDTSFLTNVNYYDYQAMPTAAFLLGDEVEYLLGQYRGPGEAWPSALTRLAGMVATTPVITAQPQAQALAAGGSATLGVTVSGAGPFIYQWRKNGSPINGATNATLSLANVSAADTGDYSVIVTGSGGTTTSSAATLTVLPAGTGATHAVTGNGYVAGGTVTITNTLTYTGTLAGLGWHVLLPAGWSFATDTGSTGSTRPATGTQAVLDWTWTSVPTSPLTFSYTLNVPAGTTGEQEIVAVATLGLAAGSPAMLVKPDPLRISSAGWHSADTDRNGRFSLLELTRVIELYNTRLGTVRTGRYKVQAGTEDGFAQDPMATANQALTQYHSADSERNGQIGLVELTRVIELYNCRSGTVRTGQYHVQAGTEDGFAPGP